MTDLDIKIRGKVISLGIAGDGNVSAATQGVTPNQNPVCSRICTSDLNWLHEDDTGVSPKETIMVLFEELLQSVDATKGLHLSLVLESENKAVHVVATAMPNGIVYAQTCDDMT